jgi:predicted amidophosphoribosyltransferase
MYKCSQCGKIMNYPQDRCPGCGVLLSGVRCSGCGHTDTKTVFINNNHRCPKCGSVVRINQGSSGGTQSNDSCFIATATYGSPMAREVMTFKQFRDDYLLQHRPGQWFVHTYYRVSPPLAHMIKERTLLKFLIRKTLLEPLLYIVRRWMNSPRP